MVSSSAKKKRWFDMVSEDLWLGFLEIGAVDLMGYGQVSMKLDVCISEVPFVPGGIMRHLTSSSNVFVYI